MKKMNQLLTFSTFLAILFMISGCAPPPCQFTNNYTWGPNLQPPQQGLMNDIENYLNDANCNSSLPNRCPPPNPNGVPPSSEMKTCPQTNAIPAASCIIWEENVTCTGPPSPNCPASNISTADLKAIADAAIIKFNDPANRPYCGCQSEKATIASYEVWWTIEALQGTIKRRILYATGIYRCCGECK